MKRMVAVEFRRVFARDITRLLGLIVVFGSVMGGIGAFVSAGSSPKTQEIEFDQTILSQRAELPARIEKCMQGPSRTPPNIGSRVRFPQLAEPQPRPRPQCRAQLSSSGIDEDDRRFKLLNFPRMLEGLMFPSAIFALIIGATMIGAEWGAGTIPNLLTWEPRRVRVLAAKILAVLAACASLFLLFALFAAVTLMPALILRGTAIGLGAIWQEDMISVVLRGMYLPALSGLFGFAFAMMIRNTAAALGAAFGYLLIAENLIRATGALHAWLVSSNAAIVGVGFSPFRSFSREEPVSLALAERSSLEAGLILGAYVLLITLISGFLFHRRDVH